jgi:cytoskeletal protein CcmA (bactofilin family)
MAKKTFIPIGAVTLLAIALTCTPAHGKYREFLSANFRTGANVTVAPDETISDDLIAAGANVEVAGQLKKGLKAFGANISIPGTVSGEVYSAGADIDLSGTFGSKVTAVGASVVLSGTFDQDVEVASAKLTLMPATIIRANLVYSAAVLEKQEGSQVLGTVTERQEPIKAEKVHEWREKGERAAKRAGIAFWFISTIALVLVGLIISSVFPNQTNRVVGAISQSPWKSIGLGLVFLVVVPVAIVIALVTVVGIPAAIIAGFLYAIIVYVSRIYIGVWIGRKVIGALKRKQITSLFWPLVVGITIIALIGLIPFIGWIFRLFCLLIGLGALSLAVLRSAEA